MPKPASAMMSAALLMKTAPLTFRFATAPEEPPRKPAAMPDGRLPLLVFSEPEWIVPAVVTAIVALAAASIEFEVIDRVDALAGGIDRDSPLTW